MDYLIHKLIWELKSADEATALIAQKMASALTEDRVFLADLERSLDRIIPRNRQLSLDRLEVDVDWTSKDRLRTQLINSISKAVAGSIRSEQENSPNGKSSQFPIVRSLQELVIAFIKQGNLPERVPAEVRTAEQFLAYIHQEADNHEALANDLRSFLKASPWYLDNATQWPLTGLLKLLTNNEGLIETTGQLEESLAELELPLNTIRTLRKTMLYEVVKADSVDLRRVRQQIEHLAEQLEEKEKVEVLSLAIKLAPRGRKMKISKPVQVKETQPAENQIAAEKFVRNAGFVLTAPFLPPLLSTLSLDPRSPDHRPQILRVFSFLDLGLQDEIGADLSLYRILLGLQPTDQIFPSARPLSEKQESEINALLLEMRNHWKVLKNTSPQGLRSNYFWRTGYLKATAEGWHLRVETKPQDVLLAHLPWSIGIIKLHWMEKPMYVDWI